MGKPLKKYPKIKTPQKKSATNFKGFLKKVFDKIKSSGFWIFPLFFLTIIGLAFYIFTVNENLYPKLPQSKQTVLVNHGKERQSSLSSTLTHPKNSTPAAQIPMGNQLRVPILYYHYVGNNPNAADLQRNALSITPDKFKEQMKYLSENHYVTISMDTLYAALKKQVILPEKSIILTFDDGYIDFYYNAYPILSELGLHATVFIITGLVEQPAYLTWSQIEEMHRSNLITYGAHSVHHYKLTLLPTEQIFQELSESKQTLQEKLGIPINFMAYPYGAVNDTIINQIIKAGFVGSVGTWPNRIQSEGTIYNMPRLRISGSIDLLTFASLL